MSESIMKEITAVGPKPIALDPSIVNYWFWKFVPVDPLVFFAPSHDGSIVRIARESTIACSAASSPRARMGCSSP